MIMNIFSVFDPCTSMFWSLNWFVFLLVILVLPNFYWVISSRFHFFFEKLMNLMYDEFKMIIKYSNLSIMYMFVCIFFMFIMVNFIGLFPYIYTLSSQLVFGLSYSLTLWMGSMIFGWMNFMNDMFIHLVPLNTPLGLIIFMVLIETVSNIIRPLTLSVRLVANMVAGHLLLGLLGGVGVYINILGVILLIFVQFFLFILEISVSIIQGYVFSVLVLLYMDDVIFK
uniref:ATP synthase subunit a n=1 Tax=Ampulex compressa TaxID=860918 RepID=A0A343DRK9_AMPCP|nr:ATP synthase F0 subunit 6 [Ampulex compressa]